MLHVSSPASLSISGLSSGYENKNIVRDLDLVVPAARTTILVGPNGCGKSTLLKTMARILNPSSGHVYLDGKDIHQSDTRSVAQKLGLLPQGPVAPEGLTVKELVSQGRFPHQGLFRQWSTQDEAAVHRAIALADIADFASRPVDSLSGGQRQRCWIAMVLAQETQTLLLDEPTTFLDLKVQVDLMELVTGLARDHGRTLVVVLHELSLAAAYADYLVMMKDGCIVCEGAPADIFTEAMLKRVFDLDAVVMREPRSGKLVCVPTGSPLASSTIPLTT